MKEKYCPFCYVTVAPDPVIPVTSYEDPYYYRCPHCHKVSVWAVNWEPSLGHWLPGPTARLMENDQGAEAAPPHDPPAG